MSSNYELEEVSTISQGHGILRENPGETYILSVNIYGKGDPEGEDRPTHWGIMTYKAGDTMGDIYHVRKNIRFFYHTQSRVVESTTLYGRSEVIRLSNAGMVEAVQVLDAYGKDDKNLPQGKQNCQD